MTAYTLSPVWGAGAQLFNNNGIPLSGGKLYVYSAGTTTAATTYVDPIGSVANTNPIIANAAGRIPNEIWLSVGSSYKFVLKDASDVLIATYDNIPSLPQPALTNNAASISFNSNYIVTAGAFTVGATYEIYSVGSTDFTAIGAPANAVGVQFTATGVGAGTGSAYYIRTVNSKLRDFVSVKDFGATGDGVSDDSAAFQAAFNSGSGAIYVPNGTYIVNSVTAANVNIFGTGTIKKKPSTKGVLLSLTGTNTVSGVTFDYDWTNADQSPPYFSNISLRQVSGMLTVQNAYFVRSFASAISVEGASFTLTNSSFSAGAPHNNLSGASARITSYVGVTADALTDNQFVEITGNTFVGPNTSTSNLHLNPTGIIVNAQQLDGVRYKSVNIVGNTLIACTTNAGGGNVTGAIDTYDGAENIVISGNTIRLFSYAGIKIQNSSNFTVVGNTITTGAVPVGSSVAQSFGIITTDRVRGAVTNQFNGVVADNVLTDCQYIGINNSCDNVVISNNIIDGVTFAVLGTGIFNTGSYVNIVGNVGRSVEGIFIDTAGNDHVKIIGNTFQSDTVASPGAVGYTGSNIDISHNSFVSSIASGGSGIRTNGPASNVRFVGNYIDGYPYGIDIRTSGGAVDTVNIADNQFKNISVLPINITSAVTNAYSDMNTISLTTVTYDPPSLAVGNASPVQTTTIAGAALGDNVIVAGGRDMLGLYVVAWVSAANTISWYLLNPTGNPNGTQNLPTTVFNFRVQKMS